MIVLEDFQGGEFGDLGAQRASRNQFHGKNVMVFQDGRIGPRPGLIELEPTGVPSGTVMAFASFGSITNGTVFVVGDTVYGFTYPDGTVTTLGTLDSTPIANCVIAVTDGLTGLITSPGDKTYLIDPLTPEVNDRSSSPGGWALCKYGVRYMVGSYIGNPLANRVYYSAADDTNSWPALNFFDVDHIWAQISFLGESRRRLAIANQQFAWWALSGVPGVNDSLARTPRADLSPFSPHAVTRVGESLWFVPTSEDFPVEFTGTITDKLRYRHLRFTAGEATQVGATSLPSIGSVMFIEDGGDHRMLMQHNNVWTFHEFTGIETSVFASNLAGTSGAGQTLAPLILCDGGDTSVAAKFYIFTPTLERPGKVSDTLAQPGDASTIPLDAEITFPIISAPDESEWTVRSVTVEFVKWDTGADETNHFDIQVTALHRWQQADTKTSAVKSWDEPTSATTEDAQPDRVTFMLGDQGPSRSFQLRITNMRGVAIDPGGITFHIDEDPTRTG